MAAAQHYEDIEELMREALQTSFQEVYFVVGNCMAEVDRHFTTIESISELNSEACYLKVKRITDDICDDLIMSKYCRKSINYKDLQLTLQEAKTVLDNLFRYIKFGSVSNIKLFRLAVERNLLVFGKSVRDSFLFAGNLSREEYFLSLGIFEWEAKGVKNEEKLSSMEVENYKNIPVIKSMHFNSEDFRLRIWKSNSNCRFVVTTIDIVVYYKKEAEDLQETLTEPEISEENISGEGNSERDEISQDSSPDIGYVRTVTHRMHACATRLFEIRDWCLKIKESTMTMYRDYCRSSLKNNTERIIDHIVTTSLHISGLPEKPEITEKLKCFVAKLRSIRDDIEQNPQMLESNISDNTLDHVLEIIMEDFSDIVDEAFTKNVVYIRKTLNPKGLLEFGSESPLEEMEKENEDFNAKEAVAGLMYQITYDIREVVEVLSNCLIEMKHAISTHMNEVQTKTKDVMQEITNFAADFCFDFEKSEKLDS